MTNTTTPSIVHDVATKASAGLTIAAACKSIIPMPNFNDPKEVEAYIAAINAQNAELLENEAKRQQEITFQARIDNEPRFGAFRNNLIIRRTPKPEEVAPAADVFDLIEVYDLKAAYFPTRKRIYISNAEFRAYQFLKANCVKPVSMAMVSERAKANKATTNDQEANAEVETLGTDSEKE